MDEKTKFEKRVILFFWTATGLFAIAGIMICCPSNWLDLRMNGDGLAMSIFFLSLLAGSWVTIIMAIGTILHLKTIRNKYRIMGLVPIAILITALAVELIGSLFV